MPTTTEIITAAYRKIGVSATGNPITAEEVEEGLGELNRMMHGWRLRGIDTTHVTLLATDAFPLATEFHEGAVYLLASRLSSNFSMPPGFDADDWFRAFQARLYVTPTMTMDRTLTRAPSSRLGYDF